MVGIIPLDNLKFRIFDDKSKVNEILAKPKKIIIIDEEMI